MEVASELKSIKDQEKQRQKRFLFSSVCMAMYVWICMALHGYDSSVWLYMAMYSYEWVFIALYICKAMKRAECPELSSMEN